MNKRLRRIILPLLIAALLLGLMPGSLIRTYADDAVQPQAQSLSEGVQNIVKRARQMTQIQWTPKKDILGWNSELTYRAGVTYTGLPYGQPVNADYVPWETSLEGFLEAVNNPNSLMYTSYSNYNKRAPYYSIDCSAFVSWAWGLSSRQTTASLYKYATQISTTSYENAQVGDCLCLANVHVVLITDITYDSSGTIKSIEISESTVNSATNYCCQVVTYGEGGAYTLNQFTSKYFGNGYILYRSKTRDNVTYTHSCAVPLEGDSCADCGLTNYLNDCTSYPSYVELTTPTASKLWNMPCSDKTSGDAEHLFTTSAGEQLTATALYLNTAGNYWYRVSYNGTTCYLYGGNTKRIMAIYDDLSISDVVAPSSLEQGKSFSIGGIITTQYTKISYIEAKVFSSDDEEVLSGNVTVDTRYYSLKSSPIDSAIKFGSLSSGTYYYKVNAGVSNYYTDDGTTLSHVNLASTLYETRFTVGSHVCDQAVYKWQWSAHPHYSCYQCSVCGEIKEDVTKPNHNNSCAECRPGKAVLTVSSDFSDGSTVTFTWNGTGNTTHYNLWLKKRNASGEWEMYERVFYAESGMSRTLAQGEYVAQLLSYNSNYWEDDGSDWIHTWADDVYFTMSECAHTYSSAVTTEPTCTTAGSICYTCTKCADSYSESIPALGHDYESVTVHPDCENGGYTEHTCNRCADRYCSDYTDALGHSYVDGICAWCGAEDPNAVVRGDLNGDGTVTSADSVILARYLAGLTELNEGQLKSADLNEDGSVTSADSVILAKYLAGVIEKI